MQLKVEFPDGTSMDLDRFANNLGNLDWEKIQREGINIMEDQIKHMLTLDVKDPQTLDNQFNLYMDKVKKGEYVPQSEMIGTPISSFDEYDEDPANKQYLGDNLMITQNKIELKPKFQQRYYRLIVPQGKDAYIKKTNGQQHKVNFLLAYLKGFKKAVLKTTRYKSAAGPAIMSGPVYDVRGRDIILATAIMGGPKLFELLIKELQK